MQMDKKQAVFCIEDSLFLFTPRDIPQNHIKS